MQRKSLSNNTPNQHMSDYLLTEKITASPQCEFEQYVQLFTHWVNHYFSPVWFLVLSEVPPALKKRPGVKIFSPSTLDRLTNYNF